MAQPQEKRQKLAFAICDYLSSSLTNGTLSEDNREGIEGEFMLPIINCLLHSLISRPTVAVQCISEAFGIDPSDKGQEHKFSIKPANLASLFDIFLNTQKKVADSKVILFTREAIDWS
jgi:small glutamine-rich tetratricopeptide repeat-containing protein alpha